jgi:RNA polymerase sigma-70 factor (ECF subfamily)
MLAPLSMSAPPDEPKDFAGFYRTTVQPLRRYLTRLLGGNAAQAEDVAQDTYVRLYPAMQRQDVRSPKAFLYTTARRLVIDQVRRRNLAPMDGVGPLELDAHARAEPDVRDQVAARLELERFERAVAGLPPGCRAVFVLNTAEHLTHAQIAERLGLAKSTVEKQHARALRLVRAALAAQTDEPPSSP